MRPFLSARWRHLLMLNYAVGPELLQPFVPKGVELDTWNGTTYVSMVGFLFQRTRVLGLAIPGHSNFEEVNLRFYVRRRAEEGWRRGVVFIKEIVPRRLIAVVARGIYSEPYAAMPMRHRVELENGNLREGATIEYAWRWRGRWNSLKAVTAGQPYFPAEDSEEAFITEHYWGYTARRGGGCAEYRVEHPRWKVWRVRDAALDCDVAGLYGEQFVEALSGPPNSAFIAEGSEVSVGGGNALLTEGF
jgi:uncharacterized protein YqjF (DUF2071 family)